MPCSRSYYDEKNPVFLISKKTGYHRVTTSLRLSLTEKTSPGARAQLPRASPAVKGGPFAALLWVLGGMSSRYPAHVLSSVRCSEAMFICVPSDPSQHRRILSCYGRPLGFLCKISGRLLSSSLLLKIYSDLFDL